MLDLSVESRGLSLPFVPFTFPTVLFRRLALQMGYPSQTFSVIDGIWAAYREGRSNGLISGGRNESTERYLIQRGFSQSVVWSWLSTAEVAAEQWWGQGTYFADFGASGGVGGAVSGVVQGAVDMVRGVGDALVSGVARSIGIPRWLVWVLVVAALAVVLWVLVGSGPISRALKRI